MDPRRAVQKYRRAAAAGGSSLKNDTGRPYRSPNDLMVTVDYLLFLLTHNNNKNGIGKNNNKNNNYNNVKNIYSLRSLVEFVEDRIRAVQTDCVKWQGIESSTVIVGSTSSDPPPVLLLFLQLQAKLVRAHILILYLMRYCKEYVVTFGKRALTTALAQYWNAYQEVLVVRRRGRTEDTFDPSSMSPMTTMMMEDDVSRYHLDEMLTYDTLFRLQRDLCEANDDDYGGIGQPVLESYRSLLCALEVDTTITQPSSSSPSSKRKRPRRQESLASLLPQFQWALQLVVDACLGHWFSLLERLSMESSSSSCLSVVVPPCRRMLVLSKCLLQPALSRIRFKELQAYNVSWRKGEGLDGAELARLLHFSSSFSSSSSSMHLALQFAQSHGLPVTRKNTTTVDNDGDNKDYSTQGASVSLQSVPIQPFATKDEKSGGDYNDDDGFVFGDLLDLSTSEKWFLDSHGVCIPSIPVMEQLLLLS